MRSSLSLAVGWRSSSNLLLTFADMIAQLKIVSANPVWVKLIKQPKKKLAPADKRVSWILIESVIDDAIKYRKSCRHVIAVKRRWASPKRMLITSRTPTAINNTKNGFNGAFSMLPQWIFWNFVKELRWIFSSALLLFADASCRERSWLSDTL